MCTSPMLTASPRDVSQESTLTRAFEAFDMFQYANFVARRTYLAIQSNPEHKQSRFLMIVCKPVDSYIRCIDNHLWWVTSRDNNPNEQIYDSRRPHMYTTTGIQLNTVVPIIVHLTPAFSTMVSTPTFAEPLSTTVQGVLGHKVSGPFPWQVHDTSGVPTESVLIVEQKYGHE